MMKWMRLLVVGLMPFSSTLAQEERPKKLTAKGYLKDMASFLYVGDSLLFQRQLQNRLTFGWYANEACTVVAEFRTRILRGHLVKDIPGYDRLVDSNKGYS